DAEAAVGLSIAGDKTGNYGVKRPLAAANDIWMAILQRKAGAAVLQADAGAGDHDAGSKSHVIGLNERHHHAALVGSGEIDRTRRRWLAMPEVLRAGTIDQPCAARKIAPVEQLSRGHGHGAGIGDITIRVGEGKLHRFD